MASRLAEVQIVDDDLLLTMTRNAAALDESNGCIN